MTFEEEVQALVSKYGLVDVEITYKKKVVLSATTQPHVLPTPQEEEGDIALARRYASGPIGTITST